MDAQPPRPPPGHGDAQDQDSIRPQNPPNVLSQHLGVLQVLENVTAHDDVKAFFPEGKAVNEVHLKNHPVPVPECRIEGRAARIDSREIDVWRGAAAAKFPDPTPHIQQLQGGFPLQLALNEVRHGRVSGQTQRVAARRGFDAEG